MDSLYDNTAYGICGNEDCGQMSAWYVWSSLGMYPMNPASGEYVFGYPLVDNAIIQLPNKKQLRLQVNKLTQSGRDGIASIEFNGTKIPITMIKHGQLLQGGKLIINVYK